MVSRQSRPSLSLSAPLILSPSILPLFLGKVREKRWRKGRGEGEGRKKEFQPKEK